MLRKSSVLSAQNNLPWHEPKESGGWGATELPSSDSCIFWYPPIYSSLNEIIVIIINFNIVIILNIITIIYLLTLFIFAIKNILLFKAFI